jgi:adenylate cyclase
MDFAAAGLLDGLDRDDRAARERLLERLVAEGVPLEELKAAVAEDRLALLPVQRVLGGRYTAREIEQRTGLPAELVLRFRRVSGLPEAGPGERVLDDDDIAAARSTKLFLDEGFGREGILAMARVLGEAMSRVAAATTGAFAEAFLKPGDSEQDVALRFAALAEQFLPAFKPVLVASFKWHLREAIQRGMLGRAELRRGQIPDAQVTTICFADLVGFTRLGGEIETQELGTMAERLGELAAEVAEPPARLVKTIGDAAMFVSPDTGPLVAVALSLVEAVQEAELPSLRAGVACGPALQRAGDFYGQPVNLASRVTGIARPDSVLCSQEVRDAAPDEFDWSFAGRHRLKGVGDRVPLHRARRLPALDSSSTKNEGDSGARNRARRPREDRRRRREAS